MGGGIVAEGVRRIGFPAVDTYNAWRDAELPIDSFIDRYRPLLERMKLAINLRPSIGLSAMNASPHQVMDVLSTYFGCQDMRYAIPWNTYARAGLSEDAPFIEAALKKDIAIVLGVGLKTLGFPETHLPPHIEDNLRDWGIRPGDTIGAGSQLGQEALGYTDTVLDELDHEFGLSTFAGFNPENEHNEYFGIYRLGIDEDMLTAHCKLLAAYVPDTTILLNTAGVAPFAKPSSLRIVSERAQRLSANFPSMHFRVGLDVYEESPAGRITSDTYVDTFSGLSFLYGYSHVDTIVKRLTQEGISFEVTECQLEDWVSEPRMYQPLSRKHLQYLLARIGTCLVEPGPFTKSKPLVVRSWGIEHIVAAMIRDPSFAQTDETCMLLKRVGELNGS